MTHLTAEQIAQWIAGERTPEAERHVAGCSRCRSEIDGLAAVLAQFQSSAGAVTAPAPAVFGRRRVVWPRWVAVAAALVLLVSVPLYRERRQREREAMARADAQLLQQVDHEISQPVPDSMDPLLKMVSWMSSSMENDQNERQK